MTTCLSTYWDSDETDVVAFVAFVVFSVELAAVFTGVPAGTKTFWYFAVMSENFPLPFALKLMLMYVVKLPL